MSSVVSGSKQFGRVIKMKNQCRVKFHVTPKHTRGIFAKKKIGEKKSSESSQYNFGTFYNVFHFFFCGNTNPLMPQHNRGFLYSSFKN